MLESFTSFTCAKFRRLYIERGFRKIFKFAEVFVAGFWSKAYIITSEVADNRKIFIALYT
jgi:hypothetical protein